MNKLYQTFLKFILMIENVAYYVQRQEKALNMPEAGKIAQEI